MGEHTIPWLCSKLEQHPLVPLSGNLVDRHRQQSLGDLDASTLRVWHTEDQDVMRGQQAFNGPYFGTGRA